jgi:hypothetical protein
MEKDMGFMEEAITKSDILELASWNQSRSDEQLRSFVARREAAIAGMDSEE